MTSDKVIHLVSGLQEISWSEKIAQVLYIDADLVVITQKHNLC